MADDPDLAALGTKPRRVRVLGAGIAGAAAARAFAARGCEVTLVAPNGVADGASGVPAAAVRPRLWRPSPHAVPDAEIVADAFRWTSRWLRDRAEGRFRACGVLVCAVDAADEAQARARAENPATRDVVQWCSREEASERAGVALAYGAAWIASGGCVDLGGLVQDLLTGDGVRVLQAAPAERADLLVDARARIPGGEVVRGQALGVALGDLAPAAVLCTNGYLCPPDADGLTWLGSTYDRGDEATDPRPGDDDRVRARFDALPALAAALRTAPTVRRFVGVRASTPQRLARIGFASPTRAVTLAHGSRGAVTAPWAGELLAAAAFGEPLPATPAQWSRLQSRARAR